MEFAGLALGIVSLAGLFTTAIQAFEHVTVAREYNEDFRLLVIQVEAARLRFFLWGQSVGLLRISSMDAGESIQSPENYVHERLRDEMELLANPNNDKNKCRTCL
jgi:hypothetical protein